jgi:zinc transport system permease protein
MELLEALQAPFMQRALAGGLLAAFAGSLLAPLIVQRRMAFLGSGLAHAAFGGVALGVFLGLEPIALALPFTLLCAMLIVWLEHHTSLHTDTAIGMLFAVSMALGVLFLAMSAQYARDAYSYLFGSVLAIGRLDLVLAAAAAIATAFLMRWWPVWTYATFDRDLARADRIPVARHDYLLAGAVAVVTVISIKVAGVILASAFLVLPAAAARLVSATFAGMTVLSLCFGLLSVAVGMLLSYQLDLPSGPVIVLTQSGLFVLAYLSTRLIRGNPS